MRSLRVILVLIVLSLAACTGTRVPTAPVKAPEVGLATPTAALPAATSAAPLPTALVPSATAPLPTASRPAATAPTAAAPAAESPWPRLLRSLNLGVPAGNSYQPRALAVHPGLGRLYVRTRSPGQGERGAVTSIDMATGQVLAVTGTGKDSFAEGEIAVDTVRNRVWVANPSEATVSVLDAATLRPARTRGGATSLALDEAGGRLYTAGPAGLQRIDAGSLAVEARAPLPANSEIWAMAVDPGAGRLAVARRDTAASTYSLDVYDTGTLSAVGSTALPGSPDSLVADPGRGRFYLTFSDTAQSALWTLDTESKQAGQERLGDFPTRFRLALDAEGGRLFLLRDAYADYRVQVRDLKTGKQTAEIKLDRSPQGAAWDAAGGRLLVSHTYDERISVVDVAAGKVAGTWLTAVDIEDVAVDAERGHLLVADSSEMLRVLDGQTGAALATLPAKGPISVDSPHARFYTGGYPVRVFNANTLKQTGEIRSGARPVADAHSGGLYLVQAGVYVASLETMTVTRAISDTLPQMPGYSPNPSAIDAQVDPGSGRLFVLINNGVPGSNNGNYLYVYEPVTYEKVLTDTERTPSYLDIDPTTGNAYVSRAYMGIGATSLLAGGQRYTARVDGLYGPLRVDPVLGRVYQTAGSESEPQLLVLDAANLDVLGSVPLPANLWLRALDPERHLLYLASVSGEAQIWSATGGTLPAPEAPAPADLAAAGDGGLDRGPGRMFRAPGDGPIFSLDGAGLLYRSDDEGRSWGLIRGGLPANGVADLAVSPDFERDETLFAAIAKQGMGLGVWKSSDGGESWRLASAGLTDLAMTRLAISPAFAQDSTLFAAAGRGGLYRSTDAGQRWTPLTARYEPEDAYYNKQSPGVIALSPDYGRDQTLFVGHYGLRRSTDGGETWTRVFAGVDDLAFSPDYARDRTLFAWSGSGGVLKSTDGGDTWSAASIGLAPKDYGVVSLLVAPDFATSRTLYFVWTPTVAETPPQYWRSTDAAATWESLDAEGPAVIGLPRGSTPVELSADGSALIALDQDAHLRSWPIASLPWQRAALPPLSETSIDHVVPSPDFATDRTLYAVTGSSAILRSTDAGLTWAGTGFPVRVTFGTPVEVMVAPSGAVFAGTPLGVYRLGTGGAWQPVGGGLPVGLPATAPRVSGGGVLWVRAGPDFADTGRQVFLSTDGGVTWAEAFPPLPYAVDAAGLLLSPGLGTDRTAFLWSRWDKPWRTAGGGAWQPVALPREGATTLMELSPAFDRDGLVFVQLDDVGLWSSTDQGKTWQSVQPAGAREWAPFDLAFSPAFAEEGLILARSREAVYRSADRGATWKKVLDLTPALSDLVFAPDYAAGGTVLVKQDRAISRSDDGGQTWKALPLGPWSEGEESRMVLSPSFSRDGTMLVWTATGRVYQSTKGGQRFGELSAGLPVPLYIRQVVFSPDFARDRLTYLVPYESGLFKRLDSGPWFQATDKEPPAAPTAAPPQPTATPLPRPTPTAAPCAAEPARFKTVWEAPEVRGRLGCPLADEQPASLAIQNFDHGLMIWEGETRQIHVLLQAGTWQVFADTFVEGVDPEYDPALPPPPQQPVRGFGKVWRDELGGPDSAIGWASAQEVGMEGLTQAFDHGLLIWTGGETAGSSVGWAYLLYDDGIWQAVRTQ